MKSLVLDLSFSSRMKETSDEGNEDGMGAQLFFFLIFFQTPLVPVGVCPSW